MSTFVQLHILTPYHPSNLNRDELGRPKTASMGGRTRLRVSSQSLKRAWRTSEDFKAALSGHIGTRSKRLGPELHERMMSEGVSKAKALAWSGAIAGQFGKLEKPKPKEPRDLEIGQLFHFSPAERALVDDLVGTLIKEDREPNQAELDLMRADHAAVDIAMFGRMVASAPSFGTEAAVQVAHALTTHETRIEDDYFSAVDDLNTSETSSAAHLGHNEFGAGIFYLYACINRDLLIENLQGDLELAACALGALTRAAATVAPTGKQANFASRSRAMYVLAERGDQAPRALTAAFLNPLDRKLDQMSASIKALEGLRDDMDAAYGTCASARSSMRVGGEGTFDQVLSFVSEVEA